MSNSEIIAIIFSSCSVLISIFALFFSRKDKPSFMPTGTLFSRYTNRSFLCFNWINTSGKTVDDLIILINCFNLDLEEITDKKIEDKFYFAITNDGGFNYSIPNPPSEHFFVRIRFSGQYSSWFPFIKCKFTQTLWYTMIPLFDQKQNGALVGFNHHQTFKEEIDKIKLKYSNILEKYEKEIDEKFKSKNS